MKIIFLDVDGVLNAKFTKETIYKYTFVMDSKISLLKQLVERTGAKIVLSSTWRVGWYHKLSGRTSTIDYFLYIALRDKFKEFNLEFFSYTPDYGSMARRGEEIDLWLRNWTGKSVESFVILDDLNGRWLRPHADRLIRTSMETGLLPKHIELAEKILSKPYTMKEEP